jgi:hypothetical protein
VKLPVSCPDVGNDLAKRPATVRAVQNHAAQIDAPIPHTRTRRRELPRLIPGVPGACRRFRAATPEVPDRVGDSPASIPDVPPGAAKFPASLPDMRKRRGESRTPSLDTRKPAANSACPIFRPKFSKMKARRRVSHPDARRTCARALAAGEQSGEPYRMFMMLGPADSSLQAPACSAHECRSLWYLHFCGLRVPEPCEYRSHSRASASRKNAAAYDSSLAC